MTTEEALTFLDGLCAKAAVNRETHEKIKQAFEKLRFDLKVCLQDLPSLPYCGAFADLATASILSDPDEVKE